jgi:GT2 family glycosyltransferase
MEISFIILTWNSERYIDECISSVIQKCEDEKVDYEIFVVDNGSSDKTKDILRKYNGKIGIIWLERNYGTTYSRNSGLKRANGDIICFLDSDAILKKGEITSIWQKLLSDINIGIIAPKLLLPDGSVQRSIKKFPSLWHKVLKLKKIFFGIEPKLNERYKEIPSNEEVSVDSAISACWFFRKELTETVGFLDEKIFYSPEDLDYCIRMWKSGKSILYYPFFTVLHHTQQISHKKMNFIPIHFKGLIYYFTKHKYLYKTPKYGEWEKFSK